MARIHRQPPSFSLSLSSFLSLSFGGGCRRRILFAGEWGRGGAGGEEDGDDDPMDGTRGDGAIGDDGSLSSNDDVDNDDRDVNISPPPLLRMENEMLREERLSTSSKLYSSSSLGNSIFVRVCDMDWDVNIDVDCVGKREAVVGRGICSISLRSQASLPRLIIKDFEGGDYYHRGIIGSGGGDGLGRHQTRLHPGITTPIDTGGRGYDDPHNNDDDDVSCVYDDRTNRWTSLNGTPLLTEHPNIVYYLKMLVGAGGNAGNQVSVRVICGLALGTLNNNTRRRYLMHELCMALSLSVVLSAAGFVRALVFGAPLSEIYVITLSLIVYPCTTRAHSIVRDRGMRDIISFALGGLLWAPKRDTLQKREGDGAQALGDRQ
ncbi:hypothetical protein ACHAXA_006578 [Cyclostephanos tholiformis]|uniref:SLC41A/MgtE integral membrane domain-containing protein n=1 Tax=Cyclostephanos tholiformis TaxID=382380 RepID=A0ABD3RUZ0_9STRA